MARNIFIVDHSSNTKGGAERFSDKLCDLFKCLSPKTEVNVKKFSSVTEFLPKDKMEEQTVVIFTASWLRKPYTEALLLKENSKKFYDLRVYLLSNVSALTPFSYLYDDMKHHFVYDIEKARKAKAFTSILCLNGADDCLWTQMGFPTQLIPSILDACLRPVVPSKIALAYMTKSNSKRIELNKRKAEELKNYIRIKYGVDVPLITYSGRVRAPESMFDRRTILFHESWTEGRCQTIVECIQCGGTVVGSYPEADANLKQVNISATPSEIMKVFRFGKDYKDLEYLLSRFIAPLGSNNYEEPHLWWKTLVNVIYSSDASWSSFGMIAPRMRKQKNEIKA